MNEDEVEFICMRFPKRKTESQYLHYTCTARISTSVQQNFVRVFFFSFHSCLWFCCCWWLESSRSLTIWFIATYIFRFDCLCSIKFADKIQSNCSNISRSLSYSLSLCVFSLVRLHICFAHLFSFVAIFRKSLPNGQHTRSKSICAKTTKSGMHHFVGTEKTEREREKELAHRPSSISNRWKCNIDKNKSKLAKRIRNEAVEKLDYTIFLWLEIWSLSWSPSARKAIESVLQRDAEEMVE